MEIVPAESPETHDYFRLIPSLTDLDLLCSDVTSFSTLVQALATAHDFLPNLCNLTLRTNFTVRTYFSQPRRYKYLVPMLTSSRRAPLQSFGLIFEYEEVDFETDGDVIIALEQLAKQGMNIHVGPTGVNLV
ncbi:hypothetical protein B0H19DRAFT_1224773 [Mycena capillaripes]|nr:hypothetical protein B0H19DRAFT_1224773 [Mycena capillaripes]